MTFCRRYWCCFCTLLLRDVVVVGVVVVDVVRVAAVDFCQCCCIVVPCVSLLIYCTLVVLS